MTIYYDDQKTPFPFYIQEQGYNQFKMLLATMCFTRHFYMFRENESIYEVRFKGVGARS